MDWAQANWELLVERTILGPTHYLEIYGPGTDYQEGSGSRVHFPRAAPTHRVVCSSAHPDGSFDLLSGSKVSLDAVDFEEFTTWRNSWHYPEPPFEHVLLFKGDETYCVRVDEVKFALASSIGVTLHGQSHEFHGLDLQALMKDLVPALTARTGEVDSTNFQGPFQATQALFGDYGLTAAAAGLFSPQIQLHDNIPIGFFEPRSAGIPIDRFHVDLLHASGAACSIDPAFRVIGVALASFWTRRLRDLQIPGHFEYQDDQNYDVVYIPLGSSPR